MMDRSLPYVRLVMTKEDMQVYPRCPLPPGYRFETWHSGLEEDWCAVQCAAGHIETLERARDVFRETFLSEPEEAAKRCLHRMEHPLPPRRSGGATCSANRALASIGSRPRSRIRAKGSPRR